MANIQKYGFAQFMVLSDLEDLGRGIAALNEPIGQEPFGPLVFSGAASRAMSTTRSAPVLSAQTADQYWVAGVASSFTVSSKTFTDPQGATLTYSATLTGGAALPSWLKFSASRRTFSGTDPAETAPASVTLTATDSYGLSTSENFTISLAAAPILVAQTATHYFLAGRTQSFTLSAGTFVDPQGANLTYSAKLASGAALPAWLTFNASTRTFTGTDPAGTGPLAVKVTARDSYGLSASDNFTIALATAPVVATQTASQYWVAGVASSFSLPAGAFIDPQGLTMTYSATMSGGDALPSWLVFDAATNTFSGIDPTGAAPVNVTVTATDAAGASGSESFAICLAAAPTVTAPTADQTWTQGQTVNFVLPTTTFTDPQGAALQYSATMADGSALPSWLSFDPVTDCFSGTLPADAAGFGLRVTATDGYGLSAAESFAIIVPSPAVAMSVASPFVINVTYDATVAAAPAGFQTAVEAAVTYLESAFTNAVTLNLVVGYGAVNGSPLALASLGGSQTSYDLVSYDQLKAALGANAAQPDQIAAVAGLPDTSPFGGAMFIVANAQAKALGLAAAQPGIIDGRIGISATNPMNFDPNNRAVAGTYDAIGVIEHEITEVIGRAGSLGAYAGYYTATDLFRYASPGVRDLVPGAGYFSVDGQTMLQAYNSPATGGDQSDWAPSVVGDAFGNGTMGVAGLVSEVDLQSVNVIGWNRSTLAA